MFIRFVTAYSKPISRSVFNRPAFLSQMIVPAIEKRCVCCTEAEGNHVAAAAPPQVLITLLRNRS